MLFRSLLVAFAAVIIPLQLIAEAPIPVSLDPISSATAELTVVSPDGAATVYTIEDLEALATYAVATTTPWRETAAQFEGIMLRDLLQANGLLDVASIRVTAENDYAITVPRDLWETVPVLIATRADGDRISRRDRGPIQFVIHSDEFANDDIPHERHLVWMAARIEVDE